MVWFSYRRRQKKLVKSILQEARHARHMREDITDPQMIGRLRAQEQRVTAMARGKLQGDVEKEAHKLLDLAREVFPVRAHPKLRENLEVVLVAVAVAMGVRTYFVQPFRIPTGSMQPTLYGITVDPTGPVERQWHETFPLSLVRLALLGERYEEVRARVSGTVWEPQDAPDDHVQIPVLTGPRGHGLLHRVRKVHPHEAFLEYLRVRPGDEVSEGQVLARGRVRFGDHILVNRMAYNFRRPRRGDIFVFSTREVRHSRIDPDHFYIKRLVGLPGERVQIRPPELVVDGEPVRAPAYFRRQAERDGFAGFRLVDRHPERRIEAILFDPEDTVDLGPEEYLAMGDNTESSLDGRYFGGVHRDAILGPAFGVYWPFSPRWGLIR